MKLYPFLLCFILLVSCGGGSGSNSSGITTQEESTTPAGTTVLDGSNITGTYSAKFMTLNSLVNGTIPGSLTLKRDEDKLFAFIRIFAGGPNAWHQQNMYVGGRCPDLDDDRNGDGFIDAKEGEDVWGKVLIPFDSDLSSQNAGKNFYPVGDASGSYFYERITSFSSLLKDLRKESTSDESFTKLKSNEPLEFEGKVIVVFGVPDSVVLPESVQTIGRRSAQKTLPIACGVISRAGNTVGVPDDGRIPGPISDVEEGQDRPGEVNEERPDGTQTGTSGSTSNSTSNEETPTNDGREGVLHILSKE